MTLKAPEVTACPPAQGCTASSKVSHTAQRSGGYVLDVLVQRARGGLVWGGLPLSQTLCQLRLGDIGGLEFAGASIDPDGVAISQLRQQPHREPTQQAREDQQ